MGLDGFRLVQEVAVVGHLAVGPEPHQVDLLVTDPLPGRLDGEVVLDHRSHEVVGGKKRVRVELVQLRSCYLPGWIVQTFDLRVDIPSLRRRALGDLEDSAPTAPSISIGAEAPLSWSPPLAVSSRGPIHEAERMSGCPLSRSRLHRRPLRGPEPSRSWCAASFSSRACFTATARMNLEEPALRRAHLGRVESWTLVMVGDDDEVTLEHAIATYRGISDAELAVIPGTSHGLLVEKPGLCNAMILDFLTMEPVATMAPIRRAGRVDS